MNLTKSIFLVVLLSLTDLTFAQSALKLINIGDFQTTHGDIIKDCKIGFITVGKPNSDSSNVILWPSWFDGNSKDIAKPRNLSRWIDTTEFYIIVVDALADGISSSPSNTNDFPDITIRDMVNSQHELLVNHLNIDHLYASIGISMGGMQVFEWMIAYPDFMDKAIPIVGTPVQSSFDLFLWQTQADMINESGTNEEDISLTMRRVYDIFFMHFSTPSFFNKSVKPERLNNWRNYRKLPNSMDYLAQLEAMIGHDIYKSSSTNLENISKVIKTDALIIVSLQDHVVNPAGSIDFANQLEYKIVELTGNCGHSAILCEAKKIKEAIFTFLQ